MPWRINIQTDGPAVQKVGVHWPYARTDGRAVCGVTQQGRPAPAEAQQRLGLRHGELRRPGREPRAPGPGSPAKSRETRRPQPASRFAGQLPRRGSRGAVGSGSLFGVQ